MERRWYAIAHTYGAFAGYRSGTVLRHAGDVYAFSSRAMRDAWVDGGPDDMSASGYREALTVRRVRGDCGLRPEDVPNFADAYADGEIQDAADIALLDTYSACGLEWSDPSAAWLVVNGYTPFEEE